MYCSVNIIRSSEFSDYAMDWTTEEVRFDSRQGQNLTFITFREFPRSADSSLQSPVMGPCHGLKQYTVKLCTHHCLVSILRICGSIIFLQSSARLHCLTQILPGLWNGTKLNFRECRRVPAVNVES